jgi:hypothetical protein
VHDFPPSNSWIDSKNFFFSESQMSTLIVPDILPLALGEAELCGEDPPSSNGFYDFEI